MTHRILPAAVLVVTALTATAHAGGTTTRACDFEVKARCATGDARVTLADGKVVRIEVDVHWCGLPRRPGYDCSIDSSRGDTDTAWSEAGGVTIVDNTAPFNPRAPDRLKITVGEEISIDLNEAQSLGRCGAGAALPRAIVIAAKKKACRVSLPEP
jgi:hypothetical protein